MLISNNKMINDSKRLGGIAQKQLPVKASYAIAKNISKMEVELILYNKERQKLLEQYGSRGEDSELIVGEGGNITIEKSDIKEWNKAITELLEIENEIAIHKFSIEALEGTIMTASELLLIEYMIEE